MSEPNPLHRAPLGSRPQGADPRVRRGRGGGGADAGSRCARWSRSCEEKRPWIERTLRRIREAEAERPPARLEDGGRGALPGRAAGAGGAGRARPQAAARRPATATTLRVRVRRAGRRCATRWSAGTAARRAGRSSGGSTPRPPGRARRYTKLSIRSQKTRWASCSSSGAMSFNWRLLLAPEEILDYVVEHEVAHLAIHDHSERFWALLGSRCPDYRSTSGGCAATARPYVSPRVPRGHSQLWASAARRQADRMNTQPQPKRLYRSTRPRDRRCLFRPRALLQHRPDRRPIVAAGAACCSGGVTLVAYVAALILVPVEPAEGEPEPPPRGSAGPPAPSSRSWSRA